MNRLNTPVRKSSPKSNRRPGARLDLESLEDRLVMNNRFVVAANLADNVTKFESLKTALTAPGLNNGDVIQIEQGATPGALTTAMLPLVKNLTIQGNADVRPEDFAKAITLNDSVKFSASQQGITFKHLRFELTGGEFEFNTNAAITDCYIHAKTDPNSFNLFNVRLLGTTEAVIANNTFAREEFFKNDWDEAVIQVVSGGQSKNRVVDNRFIVGPSAKTWGGDGYGFLPEDDAVIAYWHQNSGQQDINISGDVIERNTIDAAKGFSGALIDIHGCAGLSLAYNVLSSSAEDGVGIALGIEPGGLYEPVSVHHNDINMAGSSPGGAAGIYVTTGQKPPAMVAIPVTFVDMSNNRIRANDGGAGIFINFSPNAVLKVKLEGNDVNGCRAGIGLGWTDGEPGEIDLGGGTLGSHGGNNFRSIQKEAGWQGYGYGGALLSTSQDSPASEVHAHFNIFGVDDPEFVTLDTQDQLGKQDIVTEKQLTGNAAFVQTLYVHFLHRAGDINSLADAGGFVSQLDAGADPNMVINAIARSFEAYAWQANEMYWRYLHREGDAAGVTGFANWMMGGATLEAVAAAMLGSAEYKMQFTNDTDYVESLYTGLLGRQGSPAEVNGYLSQMQQGVSRETVALMFLGSAEYRGRVVGSYYGDLLHRTGSPDPNEVAGWVNQPLDALSIALAFAGSKEFYTNG